MNYKLNYCFTKRITLLVASLFFPVFITSVFPQDHLNVLTGHEQELAISDAMLYDFFLTEANGLNAVSARIKTDIKTPEQWAERQKYVKEKFIESIGAFPERTPLKVRLTERLERDDYWIEKIIFESRPNFFVTANVYLPKKGQRPLPAILSPCGHSNNGKCYKSYQSVYISLVKKGFIVMSYDPIGQGERSEYVDINTGKDSLHVGTRQHCQAGNLCYLTGTNLAQYFIWDGIRSIDYLISRDDVDSKRIGVTGNSGGGTLTTYISAMDERVAVSAPSCYITTLPDRMTRKGEITHDPEQNFFNILKWGIDHADMLMPHAPKPLMICAAQQDYFPFKGTLKSFNELQLLYADFGAIEKISLAQADNKHGFSLPRRERVYAWMLHWLGDQNADWREPIHTAEPDSALYCTKTGAIATSLGGETVWSMNKAYAEKINRNQKPPKEEKEFAVFKAGIQKDIKNVLVLPHVGQSPEVKNFGNIEENGITIEKIAIKSEEGIWIPGLLYHTTDGSSSRPAVLMIHEYGKTAMHELAIETAKKGEIVLSIDPRGMGETMDKYRGKGVETGYYNWKAEETNFTSSSFLIGRPILGLRVFDALTVINYMFSVPDIDSDSITIFGDGHGGLIALFAAAADERISQVICRKTLVSYRSLINNKYYDCHVNAILPNAFLYFDLPEVAAAIAPRKLHIINPIDHRNQVMKTKDAKREYNFTLQTYRLKSPHNFTID